MNIVKKPLFWTNLLAFGFAIFLIAQFAFGWNNPISAPVNGGGALTVDSTGNVGIGTPPTNFAKLTVDGYAKGITGLCIGNDCRSSWPGSSGTSALCIGFDCRSNWPVSAGGIDCGSGQVLQGINANGTPVCVTPGPVNPYTINFAVNDGAGASFNQTTPTNYTALSHSFIANNTERVSINISLGNASWGSCAVGSPVYYAYLYDGPTLVAGPETGPVSPGGGTLGWSIPEQTVAAGTSHNYQVKIAKSSTCAGFSNYVTIESGSMTGTRTYP